MAASSTADNSFNPLHVGAIIGSRFPRGHSEAVGWLSIPFTSGRSSVRRLWRSRFANALRFQSPSRRGDHRFPAVDGGRQQLRAFNPLHVGAIIGSSVGSARGVQIASFQSPSRRGDHRFGHAVSGVASGSSFQSPSRRGDHRFSPRSTRPAHTNTRLSIPFTSGRSSVLAGGLHRGFAPHFQSPSRRGDHRFASRGSRWMIGFAFQSPSRRGDHRFARIWTPPRRRASLSIPFTSGRSSVPARRHSGCILRRLSIPFTSGRSSVHQQPGYSAVPTSLSIPFTSGRSSVRYKIGQWGTHAVLFQSPSRRGDHRFFPWRVKVRDPESSFQSPSRRGDHRFGWSRRPRWRGRRFQSPSRRGDHRFWPVNEIDPPRRVPFNPLHVGAIIGSYNLRGGLNRFHAFNPLHVGAIIGSECADSVNVRVLDLSIPFTSGRSSVLFEAGEVFIRFRLSIPFTSGRSSVPASRRCDGPLGA